MKLRVFAMRALYPLSAVAALTAMSAILAPSARAGDWSIEVGIGPPSLVIVAPAPASVGAPPRYYIPAGYPPGYYPPAYLRPRYYRPPVVGYGEYMSGYDHRRWRHHHHDHDED
jgi:hypothetical protein